MNFIMNRKMGTIDFNLRNQYFEQDIDRRFRELYHLDSTDYKICAITGIVAGIIDAFLIGIPHPTKNGVSGGYLDNMVRNWFKEKFPPEEMEKLASNKSSKVPYDAQDNRNTNVYIVGHSAYFHRLLSVGHDPVLGFIVGVFDILNGTMTTIDKAGSIVSQDMSHVYGERISTQIIDAFIKQFKHIKSDVNTSMGLPVPFMCLFNLCQFGKIGSKGLTVAEIVQGMYYDGYDFQQFCAMSIPEIIIEVIIRAAWWIRNKCSLKKLPVFTSRNRTCRLDSMLFIAHGNFCSVNTIKVSITRNPCAINYTEWIRFSKLLIKEINWQTYGKQIAKADFIAKDVEEYIDCCINKIRTRKKQ